jgi:hypothetical protein
VQNDPNELNTEQKLQLAERANEIYRQQLKYMQDHLASLRSLIQDKENIIENLMLRYDLGIITQDQNRQSGNLSSDEIENEELRRKAEALAQRTILENFELREMVNELRDENFHLRNEIYELQDKINRQVLQINKLEKAANEHQNEKLAFLAQQQEFSETPGGDYQPMDDMIESDIMNEQYEEDADADAVIYDVDEYAAADDQPSHDRAASVSGNDWLADSQNQGRRMSKTMDHPANTDEAMEKRLDRKTGHHKQQSSAIPPQDFRNMNDTSSEEEDEDEEEIDLMDEEAQNSRGTKRRGSKQEIVLDDEALAKRAARADRHRRDSSAATPQLFESGYDAEKAQEKADKHAKNKAKKYSPEAIDKRNRRKAKRVANAAKNHVTAHRRKQSLVEKLLLGIDDEDDPDLDNIRDPEKRLQMKREAQKHQRKKSRQILQQKVGDKGHLSDEDAKDMEAEEKGQRYDFKARRDLKRNTASNVRTIDQLGHAKRPSISGQQFLGMTSDPTVDGATKNNGAHHRRDSSAPCVDLEFEDPDVLLHYEKLKVADLEKELSKTKDALDVSNAELDEYKGRVDNAEDRSEKVDAENMQFQLQLTNAITSKSQLAQKCAMEIMRLTMVLNTLLQIPKYKTTVQMLVDESYKAKTATNRNGLL